MAEGLLARARRVVEAGVGSVVETAERLAGPGLMRQAIRDVERAADDARRQQRRAQRRAVQAGERGRIAGERAATMKEEARYALTIGRDDLAEAAVAQKLAAEAETQDARSAEAAATEEAARFDATIADLVHRQRALEEEWRAHQLVAKEADQPVPPALDGRVVRAEQSFARALSAVGGDDRSHRASALKLDELEKERRGRAVAAELARLKAEAAAPPTPRRTRRG